MEDSWETLRLEDRTQWLRDDCIEVLRLLLDAGMKFELIIEGADVSSDIMANDSALMAAVALWRS